jgi:hypothetical protein
MAFPVPLSDMERGEYNVQVVWDRNLGGRAISESLGNLYNLTQRVKFTKNLTQVYTIKANKVVPEPVFKNTQYAKEIKVTSVLLSDFYHRSTTINADRNPQTFTDIYNADQSVFRKTTQHIYFSPDYPSNLEVSIKKEVN